MRKLSKNPKVVVGAATLLLFAFAGAHMGALAPQAPRLDSSALRSQGLSLRAMSHRLPAIRSHFKVAKHPHPAGNGSARTSIISFAHSWHFAGIAPGEVPSADEPSLCTAVLPRAPPLS